MNAEECNRAKSVDIIINKYIDDYIFRKEMKNELCNLYLRNKICG